MSDILSNEEISALLNAFCLSKSSGTFIEEPRKKSIRPYDFARPEKFSKEHLRVIKTVHNRFASSLAPVLSMILHENVEVDFLSLEQVSYRDYCISTSFNSLFYKINLGMLASSAVIGFEPTLAGACIDGLTGGSLQSSEQSEELTDIDKAIMIRVVEVALRKYEDTWAPHFILTSAITGTETQQSISSILLPNEVVLLCEYNVKIANSSGKMTLCIPAGSVEAIIPKLKVVKKVQPTVVQNSVNSGIMQDSLKNLPIPCKAILGRTNVTLEDIINLQAGDIIKLDKESKSEVEFWIDGKLAYKGRPGKAGANVGVMITEEISRAPKFTF